MEEVWRASRKRAAERSNTVGPVSILTATVCGWSTGAHTHTNTRTPAHARAPTPTVIVDGQQAEEVEAHDLVRERRVHRPHLGAVALDEHGHIGVVEHEVAPALQVGNEVQIRFNGVECGSVQVKFEGFETDERWNERTQYEGGSSDVARLLLNWRIPPLSHSYLRCRMELDQLSTRLAPVRRELALILGSPRRDRDAWDEPTALSIGASISIGIGIVGSARALLLPAHRTIEFQATTRLRGAEDVSWRRV